MFKKLNRPTNSQSLLRLETWQPSERSPQPRDIQQLQDFYNVIELQEYMSASRVKSAGKKKKTNISFDADTNIGLITSSGEINFAISSRNQFLNLKTLFESGKSYIYNM